MRKLGWLALTLFALSACATTAPQPRGTADWNQISMSAKVAKVNNIKSLITPGFY